MINDNDFFALGEKQDSWGQSRNAHENGAVQMFQTAHTAI